ncbi:Cerato-ulmin [Colletotrichum sp. SAR 10_71]|nr:Cerato-ulmin [Colletotrichum sp. SAR 10_71]
MRSRIDLNKASKNCIGQDWSSTDVFRQELFKNTKMQFTTALIAIFASVAVAAPTGDGHNGGGSTPAPYDPCSGLYDSAQCCATDVLGVADLDCASPTSVPSSANDFRKICAVGGQRARCCVLPVLGQAVLCQTPVGV